MKKIIISVGPKLLKSKKLHDFYNKENHILRLNGAHGSISSIKDTINLLRSEFDNPYILIDLPGNKVRTSNLSSPIVVDFGSEFKLYSYQITYKNFYKILKIGDEVLAQDSTLKFKIQEANEKYILFKSCSKGTLHNGKGLHVAGANSKLPFLFEKDLQLIELANNISVDYIGLSFVRTEADVIKAKSLLKYNINIIAKIETKSAVENLNKILKETNYILVDRGDLSAEVGIMKIPYYQDFIIQKALFHNKRIFLATQFLFNMVDKPVPTIAEVIGLYNDLKKGVFGVQLSEETAIGEYPDKAVEVIESLLNEILNEKDFEFEKLSR